MLRRYNQQLLLLFAILCGLFFCVHLIIIHQSLSDGTHISPNMNTSPWRENGVLVTVLDPEETGLQDNDVVLEIAGESIRVWMDQLFCRSDSCRQPARLSLTEGSVITYTVLRDGMVREVQSVLRPYPFWEVIKRTWGALVFPIVSYILFGFLLILRPQEESVKALVLAASGLLGSMGWAFGHDAVSIITGRGFWLYRFATEGIYWFSVIGVLHFMLVFPKPLPWIKNRSWVLIAIYPFAYLFYGLLLLSMQQTDNKLVWMANTFQAQSVVVMLYYGFAFVAMVFNYRSQKQESDKQKIRIVIFASGLLILLTVVIRSLPTVFFGESLMTSNEAGLLALLVPFAIVFAILRNRLWEIDLIINRTLVFTSLSVVIIGLYIIIVALMSNVFQTGTNLPASITATGIVAVLFQPIRLRLQNMVNLMMYGKRDDPVAVLTELTQQLERPDTQSEVLPSLVSTIANTLKVPYVSIWTQSSDAQKKPTAVWGKPVNRTEMFPLIFQGEVIGQLGIAPRGPNEPFTRDEIVLLNSIAALTANSVRAVQLSNEVRLSRLRIVRAREEERRRLRRDLHDGLGPQLASQILSLDAVDHLMTSNVDKAHELIAELKKRTHESIQDVRRLVYDLRPPALDDLGLVGALEQSTQWIKSPELEIQFDAKEMLPDLPAAVETAGFRIAQEAITNVLRHAEATRCFVTIECTDTHLIIKVRDNGKGLPAAFHSGVGIQSMRERTAELNGHCMIKSLQGGGTQVEAHIPVEVVT